MVLVDDFGLSFIIMQHTHIKPIGPTSLLIDIGNMCFSYDMTCSGVLIINLVQILKITIQQSTTVFSMAYGCQW